jgi:hypothetical protein
LCSKKTTVRRKQETCPCKFIKKENASNAQGAYQCMAIYRVDVLSIKKGIPPYPNLVNLKSNTMKNTMQRYGLLRNLQY